LKGKTSIRNTFVFVFYGRAHTHTITLVHTLYLYIGTRSPLSFLTAVIMHKHTHTHIIIYIIIHVYAYIGKRCAAHIYLQQSIQSLFCSHFKSDILISISHTTLSRRSYTAAPAGDTDLLSTHTHTDIYIYIM